MSKEVFSAVDDDTTQDMWNLLVEKSLQVASKKNGALLPVEILLRLAEKILVEMDNIIDACLRVVDDEGADLEEIGKEVAMPALLCEGLRLKERRRRVRLDVSGEFRRFVTPKTCSEVEEAVDEDDKSKIKLIEVEDEDAADKACKSESADQESKLDFYIENQRLMCLVDNCKRGVGFASFLALKRHFEVAHLQGRLDQAMNQIPDVGLRSVEQVKVEPDFFSDDSDDEANEEPEDEEEDDDEEEDEEDPTWKIERFPKEEADYECQYCFSCYSSRSELTKHERTHQAPFPCKKCDETLDNKEIYQLHQKEAHEAVSKDAVCGDCGRAFKNERYLERHMKHVHNGSKFSCENCGKDFKDAGKHRKHIKSKQCQDKEEVPVEKRTCNFCEMIFESKSLLLKHEKSHQGPFKCKDCGTILANKDIYKQHMKDLHSQSSDSICEECGMSFKNRRYLWGHVKNHHSGKFILCIDCGKQFKPSAYRDHRKYKHSTIPLTRIQCEFCENTFRSKLTLKTHQAIVHGKGDRTILQCDQCPRKCTSESQMKRHVMAAHLGLKQHTCPTCAKEFCHKDSLKKHQALAHGMGDQKVFKCEQCSKKFVSEARMKEHVMVMHLGVKHQCPNCSKEFSRKSSMMKHMRNGKCGGMMDQQGKMAGTATRT